MVMNKVLACPDCEGSLRYYDRVLRMVRTKGGVIVYFKIQRLRCTGCGRTHRELPESLFPYKQYEAEIIEGVLEGIITPNTIGYEDYPCEATMLRWLRTLK
ncbi:DUF6431 domain-containing protein [Lachnospiraceae bacterium 29-84]